MENNQQLKEETLICQEDQISAPVKVGFDKSGEGFFVIKNNIGRRSLREIDALAPVRPPKIGKQNEATQIMINTLAIMMTDEENHGQVNWTVVKSAMDIMIKNAGPRIISL
jgi:SpoVK/Ycf46/Vps4 family AAA+-type ATPase